MIDFVKCNKCAVSRNCTIKDELVDSKNCKSFIELDRFCMPMLVHLMSGNSIDNTVNILKIFGFRIEEKDKYPYFRLRVK